MWHRCCPGGRATEGWFPAGSTWEHRRSDGSGIADVIGTVLESVPPRRLAMTFDARARPPPDGPSRVTFDVEPYHEIIRLTVTHENLADDGALEAISAGWPAVFANLKSLLETGHVLPRAPWRCTPNCAPPRWPATTLPLTPDGPSGRRRVARYGGSRRRRRGRGYGVGTAITA